MQKSAFSLIELSIVVLIIGILIAGVTQSSRIINQARLSNARTLTQSSPVSSIRGLSLWLETSSEKSFLESEAEDSETISEWYDINPQANNKFAASQSVVSDKPLYQSSVINNLPALSFNGSSTYLDIPYDPSLNSDNFSIFVVSQTISHDAYESIISSRGITVSVYTGYTIYVTTDGTYEMWIGNGATDWGNTGTPAPTFSVNTAKILSAVYNGSTTLYGNGNSAGSLSTVLAPNSQHPARIGAGANEDVTPAHYYDGYIGEIIVFDRALKTEERESIEDYLSKKWNIALERS